MPDPALATHIWENEVILSAIIPLLCTNSLRAVSQTCRRAWTYAIPQLWSTLQPEHITEFRQISQMSATQLPIRLRNHRCYGELVREIRLSMLPGRWDKVDYTHMLMLVGSCTNLKLLDMNLCGNMRSSELVGLFLLCPSVCRSLEYLDICETGFSASAITRVLQLMPNLQHLDISDTDADDDLLVVVSQSNQKLTYLAVAGCINVSNMGIKAVVETCTKLEVVDIAECPFIDDYAFLEANNIKLEIDSERDSNGYMP